MSSRPRVEIKSKETGICQIFVDGHELKGVRRFKLEEKFADFPILTVELNAFDVTVDSPCIVYHEGLGELEINVKSSEK